jgi:hypothetical protein
MANSGIGNRADRQDLGQGVILQASVRISAGYHGTYVRPRELQYVARPIDSRPRNAIILATPMHSC